MKLIRKTIQKILLENESHEAKLITLIASADPENIIQALNLADGVGLIEITKEEEYERNWRGSYLCEFTVLAETFAAKLNELAPTISKGYSFGGQFGSNVRLTIDDPTVSENRKASIWVRRQDHYSFEDEYKGW